MSSVVPPGVEPPPVEQPPASVQWKKLLGWGAGLVIPVFIFIAVILFIRDSRAVLAQNVRFDFRYLIVSFFLQWGGYGIALVIWRRIIAAFGIRLPFGIDFKYYIYSSVGWVVPGAIWPFLMRPALYQRRHSSTLAVIAGTLIETITMGMGAFALYTGITVVVPSLSLWQNPVIGVILLAGLIALLHPKVFNSILAFVYQKTSKKNAPPAGAYSYREILLWTAAQAVVILIGGISEYFLLKSFTAAPPEWILTVVTAWAVATAAGNLVFAFPGASVIKDGAMALILATILPVPVAVLFVLIARVWSMFFILLGAGITWVIIDLPGWWKRRKTARGKIAKNNA